MPTPFKVHIRMANERCEITSFGVTTADTTKAQTKKSPRQGFSCAIVPMPMRASTMTAIGTSNAMPEDRFFNAPFSSP